MVYAGPATEIIGPIRISGRTPPHPSSRIDSLIILETKNKNKLQLESNPQLGENFSKDRTYVDNIIVI